MFTSLGQFSYVSLECFHFHDVFRRRIYMRATYICLDVVETVHQTVHCTVGSILQLQNKNEKLGGVRVGCPLICPKLCRGECASLSSWLSKLKSSAVKMRFVGCQVKVSLLSWTQCSKVRLRKKKFMSADRKSWSIVEVDHVPE